jgi:hypothetical protein
MSNDTSSTVLLLSEEDIAEVKSQQDDIISPSAELLAALTEEHLSRVPIGYYYNQLVDSIPESVRVHMYNQPVDALPESLSHVTLDPWYNASDRMKIRGLKIVIGSALVLAAAALLGRGWIQLSRGQRSGA